MGTTMKAMKGMKVMKAKKVSVNGQGSCLPRHQGEDRQWHDQSQPRQEQEWQDRFQGRISPRQEGLRQQRCQGLARCVQGSPQGSEPHWLCSHWWQVCSRQGVLRQGQGFAQVKRDSREELLPTLGFKHSVLPSWVSRGETLCRRRMRC